MERPVLADTLKRVAEALPHRFIFRDEYLPVTICVSEDGCHRTGGPCFDAWFTHPMSLATVEYSLCEEMEARGWEWGVSQIIGNPPEYRYQADLMLNETEDSLDEQAETRLHALALVFLAALAAQA